MMNELISVIMPSYNTASYIEESVQSVLNQTYRNLELIIVDDCSTDNTDEVVQHLLGDKRIRYYKNNENSGAAVSRNRALREAKGRWIAFLDSDDLWEENKLEKQVLFMEENGFSFSYTEYIEINEMGNELGTKVSGPQIITKRGMHAYCWPGCLTVMYDRKAIGEIQIKDIKKNNDYAMWIEICKKTNCYLLTEVLAKYRKRSGSISRLNYSKLVRWHYRLWRDVEEKNPICAISLTGLNLICGIYKKFKFVERGNSMRQLVNNHEWGGGGPLKNFPCGGVQYAA